MSSRATEKKKRRLRLLQAKPVEVDRRKFAVGGVALLAAGVVGRACAEQQQTVAPERPGLPIRPPMADLNDKRFQEACIRCGLCGTVCENGCIRFFGADEPNHGRFTPFLDVRRRSCTLCMRCTNICPTGALTPVEKTRDLIVENVRMGKAVVDPEHCISYQGRLCGFCHDACPIASEALHLTPPALPVVQDGCVGCGRCVELCPQRPTAIRVERRTA